MHWSYEKQLSTECKGFLFGCVHQKKDGIFGLSANQKTSIEEAEKFLKKKWDKLVSEGWTCEKMYLFTEKNLRDLRLNSDL